MPSKLKLSSRKPAKKRPSRGAHIAAQPTQFVAETTPRRMSFTPIVISVLTFVVLYFSFRKSEFPLAHKVAAGLSIATPETPPATAPATAPAQAVAQAPALAPQAAHQPQKRATSPAGPRVWNRKTMLSSPTFRVLRDKDGNAEISIFKAGSRSLRQIRAEKGSKGLAFLVWDGMDSNGKPVEAGTYYARISGGHGESIEEILVK